MFFPLSKLLWSLSGPLIVAAVFLGLAIATALRPSRRRALAVCLVLLTSAALASLTLPPVANTLEASLASSGRTTMKRGAVYDAAVALGDSQTRLFPAADLVRDGRARYLLYSGTLSEAEVAEYTSMLVARGVPRDRIVFETRSRNTRENAVESARILATRDLRSFLLVTSATHMERALGCFHRLGLRPDVLAVDDRPAPLTQLRPRRAALARSEDVLREVVGRVVYRLVGYSS